MWPIIILKVTKKQGFTLSLEDTVFKKPQGEVKLTAIKFQDHTYYQSQIIKLNRMLPLKISFLVKSN